MTIAEALAADFKAESEHTRAVLEAVPGESLAWAPHEKSMTLGRLAGHLAELPGWLEAMLEPELDFASMDYTPWVPASVDEVAETFGRVAAAFTVALQGRDDAFMEEPWTMRMGEHEIATMPRHEAIRTTCIHHAAHHRGQLTVYLRLLGVPVPRTYGSTADYPSLT